MTERLHWTRLQRDYVRENWATSNDAEMADGVSKLGPSRTKSAVHTYRVKKGWHRDHDLPPGEGRTRAAQGWPVVIPDGDDELVRRIALHIKQERAA